MQAYRIRAYRRQLVEVIITALDDEYAFDAAIDIPAHEWDVIQTLEVEEPDSITLADPCDNDDSDWHLEKQ